MTDQGWELMKSESDRRLSTKAREVNAREGRELAERFPLGAPIAAWCHNEGRAGARRYECTREQGHEGPHVAWAPSGIVAIWGEQC